MPKLTWDRFEDIGIALHERFPDMDPTNVRYTDMHKWIVELDDFDDDDPMKSNESKLEAIQMAWLEEWKDNQ